MRACCTYLALTSLICLSAVAVADTLQRGDSTITFSAPALPDNAPMPVGGVAALYSKLYYPPQLRTRPYVIHGKAIVLATIEANGRVSEVSLSPRMHPELERVVIQAFHACQWKPARKHSVPVRASVRFPISFDTYKK